MTDLVFDTDQLSEFLIQYFNGINLNSKEFIVNGNFNINIVKKLNKIVYLFKYNNSFSNGLVITSSFAFVEIARQFKKISKNQYSIEQFKAFIDSPPEWFEIAPLNSDLFNLFNEIPINVNFNGSLKKIEWADAIHAVTALSRDKFVFATTDKRLQKVPILNGKLI